MGERHELAGGGGQRYLREVQYVDGSRLDVRSHLHRAFATAPEPLPVFEAALVEWRDGATVLECGCGNGRFWDNPALPRSLRLTLTDLSPGMVDEAMERVRPFGFAAVAGRACDVQALPFDDHTFDVVLANHMLYHVPDPDRAVAELARVVRPDGAVLAATNGFGHMDQITQLVAEVFDGVDPVPRALDAVFGIDTGEARLRRAFRSVTWHAFDNDLLVDDPDAVVAYGLSIPPGDGATPEQRARFEAAVRRRFTSGPLRIHTRGGVFVAGQPRAAAR